MACGVLNTFSQCGQCHVFLLDSSIGMNSLLCTFWMWADRAVLLMYTWKKEENKLMFLYNNFYITNYWYQLMNPRGKHGIVHIVKKCSEHNKPWNKTLQWNMTELLHKIMINSNIVFEFQIISKTMMAFKTLLCSSCFMFRYNIFRTYYVLNTFSQCGQSHVLFLD